jgi:hypothetical protein
MPLRTVSIDELTISDEDSVAPVGLYGLLKEALRRSNHRFLLPARGTYASWDRVLFLNLTFWSAQGEQAGDVLCDEHVPADVIAHVAWHHVVSQRLARLCPPGPPTAEALLFAESIASAFDLYLVGRLLVSAPESDFITTQVPIMSECAQEAGLSEAKLAQLMREISEDPERAFEDLRELLLDAALALLPCRSADEAQRALESFAGHRFEPLLHHYQLSNWILYARAYSVSNPVAAGVTGGVDTILRQSTDALGWLSEHWVAEAAKVAEGRA